MTGASTDIMNVTLSALTSAVNDGTMDRKTAYKFCKRLMGLSLLIYRLLINHSQGLDEDYKDLVTEGFLSTDEYKYIKSVRKGRISLVTSMIMNHIHIAAENGIFGDYPGIADARVLSVTKDIIVLRDQVALVQLYIDIQIPFPFVQLVAGVVFAFIMQLIFVTSTFLNYGFAEKERAFLGLGYLTINLYTFVLLGLLKMFVVYSNPLGNHAANFPVVFYYARFMEDLKSMMEKSFALIDSKSKLGRIKRTV
jgi:hypothetical protein